MPQILLRASTTAFGSSARSTGADGTLTCAVFLNPSLATQDDFSLLLRRFQEQHRHWARQVEYLRHANLIIGNKNQAFGIGVEVPASLLPQLLEILSTTPLSSASHVQLVDNTTEELVAKHAKKHLRINSSAARRLLRKPGHRSPGTPPRHSVLEAPPLKVASAADC